MIVKGQQDWCSKENELRGFNPSEETVQEWLQKIKDNGVEDGTEVLVIGGLNENKVVTFNSKSIKESDCGLGSCDFLGWYYRVSDDKVCKPLYKKYTEQSFIEANHSESELGNMLGVTETEDGRKHCFILSYAGYSQNNIANLCEITTNDEFDQILDEPTNKHYVYVFNSAKEMFLYLAHQEEEIQNNQD